MMCIWSCFAGLGAVKIWNDDYVLFSYGIYDALTFSHPIEELDKYVTELIGLRNGSDESKKLNKHIALQSADAAHNFQDDVDALRESMKAMYYYGMIIEMNRLGMR